MSDLDRFLARMVSFDTETYLAESIPPLVCGSTAHAGSADLLSKSAARRAFMHLLEGSDVITGANIAFDMGVMAADAFEETDDEAVLRAIFAKYDRDEVFDIQIAEALNAIAGGHLFKDPRTGGDLKDPATGKRGRYSLSIVVDQVLGRQDAKVNDFWRKRYAILERVPVEHWPGEAKQYPKDDARNTLEVAIAQTRTHRNLACMPDQARAAFALHLATSWGFRTDAAAVDKLESEALAERAKTTDRWLALGFLTPAECGVCGHEKGEHVEGGCDRQIKRGRKNVTFERCTCTGYDIAGVEDDEEKKASRVVKARLARSFGAGKSCSSCNGTGKVLNAKGTNQVFCTDKNLAARGLTGCDGTGLDLADAPLLARTPTGNIKAGRDEQLQSGDEELIGFAEYQEDDKLLNLYIPFVRKGTESPLHVRANVLVASGRTSYDDVIQQMPREGGVRSCFCARPGCVFCSTDYSSGELCTFGQVAIWTVGRSKMAEIINATKDPGALHSAFGAKMAGLDIAEFNRLRKAGDKRVGLLRQGAKAANFGFLGGMGAVKFVIAKRKKAEGLTTGPDGRVYYGLRFCIMLAGAERCGSEMVTEWKRRPTPPVCRHCIQAVEQLRSEWLAFFDEVPAYFDFVKKNVDATGEIGVCPCGLVRGGLDFPSGANHNFQHLLSCGAKRALWLISREMYTDRNSALYGSRVLAFFHDEVFSEMPEGFAPAAGVRQAELMVQGLKEYCPDVFVACEPALMRRWSKAAEPVWLERDGVKTLGVWEPKTKDAEPYTGDAKRF